MRLALADLAFMLALCLFMYDKVFGTPAFAWKS
jgi:hypothetical protein